MDKSNKHSKDPPKKRKLVKPCDICGGTGYHQRISICCRCKITREHSYCMKIMHHDNPKDWVCEECESGDQTRACSSKPGISKLGDHARACSSTPGISRLGDQNHAGSSKPGVSRIGDQIRACSSKPGPSKEPNNTTIRGNIMKPPRNSKVQYITPEDARRLDSGALKKKSPWKLNSSCSPAVNRTPPPKSKAIKCSTVNRTPAVKSEAIRCSTMNRTPPKFSGKPNTPVKPPVIKLQSPSSLPNPQQNKKLSGSKDTEKHVVKKQHVRQDSPLAIRSAKESQTSNTTAEERRAAQPLWRKPSASKSSPGKNIKPNAERDNANPGQISRQLAEGLLPVRSDKGPSRQLYRDNFAGMPVPREKVQCNTERVVKNAGHASMQSVHHSLATSSDTENYVVKKQHVRQDSPLAIRSVKEAQTSNVTAEERRDAQPFWRKPSASKSSPGKNIKRNAERDNANPGQISRQLAQDLLPVRSDKGPSRQLYRDNFAGMPVPYEKVQCNTERDVKNAGHASMQSVHHPFATSSGKESLEFELEFDRYLQNHPAEISTWKGRFNIRYADDVSLCRSIGGIQAHPPCKVQRKAYDLSLKLPKVLEFELLPRLHIWGNLFDCSVPDSRDIGLYFLSPKVSTLLDEMYEHNMLLRSQIDGVELLVFSSQHLAECSQKINNKFFLWGLFRPLEDETVALGGESSEHREINLSGGYEESIAEQLIPKLPKDSNANFTVQTVPKSPNDANVDPTGPTLETVRKRARNANQGLTVQAVQKSAKDTKPDTTMLQTTIPKPAKDANSGPRVDKLIPVKIRKPRQL